jgi:hypothetical protein
MLWGGSERHSPWCVCWSGLVQEPAAPDISHLTKALMVTHVNRTVTCRRGGNVMSSTMCIVVMSMCTCNNAHVWHGCICCRLTSSTQCAKTRQALSDRLCVRRGPCTCLARQRWVVSHSTASQCDGPVRHVASQVVAAGGRSIEPTSHKNQLNQRGQAQLTLCCCVSFDAMHAFVQRRYRVCC